jgi:NAD+ synthase
MSSLEQSLQLDLTAETTRIVETIRRCVLTDFKKRGAVVGVSGGVDSAVVLALTVRALGAEHVLALNLPERDSHPESALFAAEVAARYGVAIHTEDLTPALAALGCYARRDAAVREVFPEYDPTRERIKLVLPSGLLDHASMNIFSLVLVHPDGTEERRMLPPSAYLSIVAASNMKQRTRMLMLYHHAEKRVYAVVGTSNRNEHDQGFFVKYGDGGADVQPIQHLLKTQVYQLARYLDVPQGIIVREPTTDTYSADCTQQEFYFRVPFALLDRIWWGIEHGLSVGDIAHDLGLSVEQVERVHHDLVQKERSTAYLRAQPVVLRE